MMSKFFIERPVLANVLAIVMVLIGAVAVYNLPVSQYPNIVPPTVQVTTRYPGASPQTVIDTIALPIELQINGVDGMIYMQSTSAADGTYVLTVTFKIGMDPDTAQVLIQNRVSNVIASLPAAAVQAQGVSVQKKSTAILQIITLDSPGDTYDALYLSNYATINLVNELARLPGVGNVKVFGAAQYAMRIWLDPAKLQSISLVPQHQRGQATEPSGGGRADRLAACAGKSGFSIYHRYSVPARRSRPIRQHCCQGPNGARRAPRARQGRRANRTRLPDLFAAMLARWAPGRGNRHLPDPRRKLSAGR